MSIQKRVCFIGLVNQYLLPYMKKYIAVLDCKYDIIFWNRHGLQETSGAQNQYSYEFYISENTSRLKKLKGYLGFAEFAKQIIIKNHYDSIILTNTSTGMILRSVLKKYYKGHYIVDIRDYTMENNPLFFWLEKNLIKNAAFNVISSAGYENFLPAGEYVIVHNELDVPIQIINEFRNRDKKNKEKIVLTYIGLIRFHEQNKKIIDLFCNDARYEIRFIGTDAYALKDYCREKHADNVILVDRFLPETTFQLLKDTDIILNLYGNHTPLLDYALSNKLYYAAKLGMPILVCPDTYMEEVSVKYGFGYSLDLNDPDFKLDDLYYYYNSINWTEFYLKCDTFLAKVNLENLYFNEKIRGCIDGL